MQDDVRYVTTGAVLGAIVGAIGAWTYLHFLQKPGDRETEGGRIHGRVEGGRLVRLGWSVVGIIRQILELG